MPHCLTCCPDWVCNYRQRAPYLPGRDAVKSVKENFLLVAYELQVSKNLSRNNSQTTTEKKLTHNKQNQMTKTTLLGLSNNPNTPTEAVPCSESTLNLGFGEPLFYFFDLSLHYEFLVRVWRDEIASYAAIATYSLPADSATVVNSIKQYKSLVSVRPTHLLLVHRCVLIS